MFEREHHQKILTVLNHLNADLLAECQAYFGGGTLVSLNCGEHRLSEDIDFLCSCEQDFLRLRRAITEGGYNAIFTKFDNIVLPEPIKNDRYAIRFTIKIDNTPIKLEIVLEGNIEIGNPDYPSWSPVACLNQTDSFAAKLLANTDRWPDRKKNSRDLIDLAVLRLASPIPDEALAKTEKAFYPAREHLKRSIQFFQDNPDYREECYKSLEINAPATIIDGIDLLAAEFGLEATERTFMEYKWEYLEYSESEENVKTDQIEASAQQTPNQVETPAKNREIESQSSTSKEIIEQNQSQSIQQEALAQTSLSDSDPKAPTNSSIVPVQETRFEAKEQQKPSASSKGSAALRNLAAVILAKRLLEAVGKDTYETDNYFFSRQGETLTITASDGRGEIARSQDEVVTGDVSLADISKLNELEKSVAQILAQAESQQQRQKSQSNSREDFELGD